MVRSADLTGTFHGDADAPKADLCCSVPRLPQSARTGYVSLGCELSRQELAAPLVTAGYHFPPPPVC